MDSSNNHSDPLPKKDESIGLSASSFALLLCLFWGGLTPGMKIALEGMPPIAIAGWRFLIGLAVIWLWAVSKRIPLRLPRSHWLHLLVFALVFVVQLSATNIGIQKTSANYAVILLNTFPIFVAILAHLFLSGDRLSLRKMAGLLLAFLGVAFVFLETPPDRDMLVGNLFCLLSGFLLAVIQVYGKFLLRSLTAIQIVFWEILIGVPFFFVLSGFFEPSERHITVAVALSILYQGAVVAGFCFVSWMQLLKRYPASKLTALSFSIPVFGVVLSWALLGEPITLRLIFGVAGVAAGIFLVSGARSADQLGEH
jgi:drug/metabolite transporter (DMT)-like permease